MFSIDFTCEAVRVPVLSFFVLIRVPSLYSRPNAGLDVGDQQGTRRTLTPEECILQGETLPRPLLVYFLCFYVSGFL